MQLVKSFGRRWYLQENGFLLSQNSRKITQINYWPINWEKNINLRHKVACFKFKRNGKSYLLNTILNQVENIYQLWRKLESIWIQHIWNVQISKRKYYKYYIKQNPGEEIKTWAKSTGIYQWQITKIIVNKTSIKISINKDTR